MEISYSESRPDLENVSLIVSIARLRVVFASNSADRPRRDIAKLQTVCSEAGVF